MFTFALAFSYGLAILLGFYGWGSFLDRLLFHGRPADGALRAAWGLAFSIAVGGVLNLLGLVGRGSVLSYLGIGIALGMLHLQKEIKDRGHEGARPTLSLGLVAVFLSVGAIGMLHYASAVTVPQFPGAVFPRNFNPHDDYQAYLVFPQKMLQTGSLGSDPFNERRLVTGFGAQAFLHTFVLSGLPAKHLFLMDPGLGLLLVLALAAGELVRRRASPWMALMVLAAILAIPPPTVNSSSLLTGTALFLAYTRTMAWPGLPDPSRARAALEALLLAAICALKFSLLPAALAMLVASFLLRWIGTERRLPVVRGFALTAGLGALFCAPWSIAMFRATGTFLYPLLGRGNHLASPAEQGMLFGLWSRYEMATATTALLATPLVMGILVLAAGSRLLHRPIIRGREPSLSLLAGVLVGILSTAIALGTFDSSRFIFPMACATLIYLLCESVGVESPAASGRWRRPLMKLMAALAASVVILGTRNDLPVFYRGMIDSTRFGLGDGNIVTPEEISRYRRLQDAVPAGDRLLVRLEKPFLLDFNRHQISVVDRPGQVGPPPGLPFLHGSEPVAEYLLTSGMRFVAYDYAAEAGFSRQGTLSRVTPRAHPWVRGVSLRTLDFQDNLSALARSRHRLYDDGRTFVLDLGQRDPPAGP
jgi:hypothetical protein